MMKEFEGKMFKVGDEDSWTIVDKFSDALEVYNVFKSFSQNAFIIDAITDKIIKK